MTGREKDEDAQEASGVNAAEREDASASATAGLTEHAYLRLAANQVLDAAETQPVAVDPDLAAYMGAFEEDALTEEDALMSLFDGEMPADSGEA